MVWGKYDRIAYPQERTRSKKRIIIIYIRVNSLSRVHLYQGTTTSYSHISGLHEEIHTTCVVYVCFQKDAIPEKQQKDAKVFRGVYI